MLFSIKSGVWFILYTVKGKKVHGRSFALNLLAGYKVAEEWTLPYGSTLCSSIAAAYRELISHKKNVSRSCHWFLSTLNYGNIRCIWDRMWLNCDLIPLGKDKTVTSVTACWWVFLTCSTHSLKQNWQLVWFKEYKGGWKVNRKNLNPWPLQCDAIIVQVHLLRQPHVPNKSTELDCFTAQKYLWHDSKAIFCLLFFDMCLFCHNSAKFQLFCWLSKHVILPPPAFFGIIDISWKPSLLFSQSLDKSDTPAVLTYEFLNQHHNVGHCLSLCDEGDKGQTHYGALHKVAHLVIRSPI